MFVPVDSVNIEASAVVFNQQSHESIAIPYSETDVGCIRVTNSVVEGFLSDLVQKQLNHGRPAIVFDGYRDVGVAFACQLIA